MTEAATWQLATDAWQPRVLVVDDDAGLRQVLQDVLSVEGFHVSQVDSALQLAELVRVEQPDVVLLDQTMEPVSGIEALQALRMRGEQVPVLMLTGVPPDELLESAVDVGADDYVAKPFSNAVLVAHLRAMLRRVAWRSEPRDGTSHSICGPLIDDRRA